MRVVLVGAEPARRRLRALVGDSLEIAGEAATIESARAAGVQTDAWLIAAGPSTIFDSGEGMLLEPLTAREREVLELVADGCSNRGVAERLHISDQTVKFHVAAICSKLGAINRTDAVRRALRLGILSL
ncbi:MAG TPA: LuxR C-terminal-related transcriptional regulator [Vicinamibacterales bacterium]|nr:LuxR C-terminal-related transcriptional regulator [Vicinamibacterales bacterium]